MQVHDPYPHLQKPVLLIHGLGSTGSSWQLQCAALAEAGYRPIVPDLPGFGGSPFEKRSWTFDGIVAELSALIGNRTMPVIGISMGGILAQMLALQKAKCVQALILVSTFACLRPRDLLTSIYLVQRLVRASILGPEQQADLVARRLFPREGSSELRERVIADILSADRRSYRAAMFALATIDLRSALDRISIPTLVISGAEDTTVPLDCQKDLAARIRHAEHVVIPSAGHAVIIDQPVAFNRLVLKFLESSATATGGVLVDQQPAAGR